MTLIFISNDTLGIICELFVTLIYFSKTEKSLSKLFKAINTHTSYFGY